MTVMTQVPVALTQDQEAVLSLETQHSAKDHDSSVSSRVKSKSQNEQEEYTYSKGQVATKVWAERATYYSEGHSLGNPAQPSRSRTSSNNSSHSHEALKVHKSASTPIPSEEARPNAYPQQHRSSMLLKQQQQQHYASVCLGKSRQSPLPSQASDHHHPLPSTVSPVPSPAPSLDSGRRSSITSVSSAVSHSFSIRSEMSVNTKLSFSKRLRKVFSMSHLRPSKDNVEISTYNGSQVSLATVHENATAPERTIQLPARRRSFASLSSLFQKHATISETPQDTTSVKTARLSSGDLRQLAQQKKSNRPRPELRVDTDSHARSVGSNAFASSKKNNLRGPPSTGPESPNSTASARSSRLPPPRFMGRSGDGLPSPSPSSSSTSSQRHTHHHGHEMDMAPPPTIAMQYGLPLHGSPRLRPAVASSSSSSIVTMTDKPRRIHFCPTVQVHETFAAQEYDRTCDSDSTCSKLTPLLAMKIKQELNEYKLVDMQVHIESRQYTHFFL